VSLEVPFSRPLSFPLTPSTEAGGGSPPVDDWPIAGSLAAADFVGQRYRAGSSDLTVAQAVADSAYQGNGQPEGGADFRLGGPFVAANDIGAGGIVLAGYGPRIFGVQVPAGPLLDELVADERTIVIEVEDITGGPSWEDNVTGIMLWAQDGSDTYTIEIDAGGNGRLDFYDYDVFGATIPAGYTWHASGINRLGVTFSGGQASISINGDAAVSGALDRGAQAITQFHIGPYLGADVALRKIIAFPAKTDADLAAATAVADPTGLLNRADANLYDFNYYEVFDATVPMEFAKDFVAPSPYVNDGFFTGFDPYLWDVTDPGNVNLTPLPGVNCVAGSGLYVDTDLSLLPALDATIYVNFPVNGRLVFVVEWLEDQGDVTRKAGLLSQFYQRTDDGNIVGYLQAYFEAGHFKLRVLLLNADDSTNLDVTLVGPAVSAATITRAAFLWDPATGDLAASVNGGAPVTGTALPVGGATVGGLTGKPVGFISEPVSPSGVNVLGAQTVSAGLGGYIRTVDSLHSTFGVGDLATLSAL
jgi:hypothetical protein